MEKLAIDLFHEPNPLFARLIEFLGQKAGEEVRGRLCDNNIHVEVSKVLIDLEGRLVILYQAWPRVYRPAAEYLDGDIPF